MRYSISSLLVLATAGLVATTTAVQAQTLIGGGKSAPAFPITISQPGSYKLAGSLVVPAGSSGIVINAANVTLDLDGHSITGGNVCSGAYNVMTCSGSTSSVGVDVAAAATIVSIRNGQISGFGFGVRVGAGSAVADLRINNISSVGLMAGAGSTVRDVNIVNVKVAGLSASSSLVERVNIGYTPLAVLALDSLIIGSMLTHVGTGIQDNSYGQAAQAPALRESLVRADQQAFLGTVRSLGNNSCNGLLC